MLNTKEDILKSMGKQTVAGPHLIVGKYTKKQVFHVLQNSIYVQQKKETRSDYNNLRVRKWWYKNKTKDREKSLTTLDGKTVILLL